MWFTEPYVSQVKGAAIGRLDPSGQIKFFATPSRYSEPADLVWDGSCIWFSEYAVSKIGRIDDNGIGPIEEFPTQTPHAGPIGMTRDAFGNVWVAERDANRLGWFGTFRGYLTDP